MAVTKTHPIKSTLKAAIDYICNPAKTDGKLLVSAYGCTAETADIEFAWTRRHAIDKGTNLGRHLIQAFQPGEVTPEQAHKIGMQLAKEVLGGKYEFVLTTHIDKDHVHNHLIFNAVSFTDHKHYHSNKRSYHYIRRTSDRICKEHGLLIDIQNNVKAQQSTGFTHWAKLNNLKQAAMTMNFLSEHGIDSYERLEEQLSVITEKRDIAHEKIKRIEGHTAELSLVMKHAETYRQLKPVYDRYRKSGDKEKFMRGHESDIILFEAAARELKRMGAVPLPAAESTKTELSGLHSEKENFHAEYKTTRSKAQEYETIKKNVDTLLSAPKEQERKQELE